MLDRFAESDHTAKQFSNFSDCLAFLPRAHAQRGKVIGSVVVVVVVHTKIAESMILGILVSADYG